MLYAGYIRELGKWCRVQVLNFSTESVTALSLDYGAVEELPVRNLHSLEGQFLTLPFQAICCSLTNLANSSKNWTSERVHFMKELVNNEESLRAVVCNVTGYKVELELYLVSGQAVSDLLKQSVISLNTISTNELTRSHNSSVASKCSQQMSGAGTRLETRQLGKSVGLHKNEVESFFTESLNDGHTGQLTDNENDGRHEKYLVKILHCASPKNIVVCFTKDFAKLQALISEMNGAQYCVGHVPRVGELVAAQYSVDCRWYRARVVFLCDGNMVKVNYVDFGNEATVDIGKIARLEPKFSTQPVWSMSVELYDADQFLSSWNEERLLGTSNEFEMVFMQKSPNQIVKLIDASSGLCVTDLLEQQGRISVISHNTPNQPMEEVKEIKQHVDSLLKVGEKVSVVFVESPSSFYVQVSSNIALFHKAVQQIEQHCSLSGSRVLYDECSVGELIAAFYDGAWCRAEVISTLGGGRLKLFFIDYGNVDIMSVSDLSLLPNGLPQLLPPQALWCTITDSNGHDWSSDAIRWFKMECEYKCFNVVEVCSSSHHKQHIIDIQTSESRLSVRQELIAEGYLRLRVSQNTLRETDQNVFLKDCPVLCETEGTEPVEKPTSECTGSSKGFSTTPAALQPVADDKVRGWCEHSEEVFVVHANTPADFYIQSTDEHSVMNLTRVMTRLKEACNETARLDSFPVKGEVIAARYSDGNWYRGEVIELKSDNRILVHFVDYGNTNVVNVCDICSLPADVYALPKQAVHCGIDRLHGNGENGHWSDISAKWFNSNCVEHAFILKYIYKSEIDACWQVDLMNKEREQSVRELMLAERLACSVPQLTGPASSNSDSAISHLEVSKDTTAQALLVQSVMPSVLDLSIQSPHSSAGKKYHGHVIPKVGMQVIIAYTVTPSDFYLQSAEEAEVAKLINVIESLTCFCESFSDGYHPKHMLEPVAAKYQGEWHRAEVTEFSSNQECKVRFVDYGNEDTVCTDNIRPLPVELTAIAPKMAFHCAIDGITANASGQFARSVIDYFKRLLPDDCLATLTSVKCGRSDKFLVDLTVSGETTIKNLLTKAEPSVSMDNVGVRCPTKSNAGVQYIESMMLKDGDLVFVVNLSTPANFYVRHKCNMLFEIQKKLQRAMSSSLPYHPRTAGELIAVKCDDGWSRARVETILSSGCIRVHCVDFGISLDLASSEIRTLPSECIQGFPQQTVNCALSGFETNTVFNDSCVQKLRTRCDNVLMKVQVASQTADGGQHVVDLIDCNTGESMLELFASWENNQGYEDAVKRINCNNLQVHRNELSRLCLPNMPVTVAVSCTNGSAKFYCYPVSNGE
jgi:hypothetical protein